MLYRQIILEWGQDTESGVWGLGYSPDNGKNFYVLNTTHGRKYRAEDGNRLYPYISDQIQDKIDTVVAPAKSAANSAYSMASQAVEQANVTKQAQAATDQAVTEAKQGANEAMSRAESAWDVATGAKEAITDFDPLLKSAQSDASQALTQIADTANALSDAKTQFGSDVAAAKELANTAQTTADSAVAVASDASSNATVAIQTASGASQTATNAQSDATIAKQTASEAKVQASNANSDFAQLSIRANKIEANVATNSGAIASVQQTANGLTTTVGKVGDRVKTIEDKTDWTTKTGPLDMDTLTTTQNIYYRDTNLTNADGEAGWAYIQVVSMGERVMQTVWHDRSSIQHTRTGAVSGSSYNWDAWNKTATYAQVAQVEQTANGINTIINDPKTGLNATYQTAAGNANTISNVKGDVTQLQSTANGLTSRVGSLESKTNTQQTAIDQNKAAIALKADQTTVDTLKGTVSQNTATLKTQADLISSKVTSSDVTGMLTDYATQEYTQSLVTQKADDWNLNLTKLQTDVNVIKTTGGGANLASGTSSEDQSYGDASQTTGWRTPIIATFDNPQAGQQYTISVNTKTNGGSWRIQVWDGTSPTQRVKEVYGEPPIVAQEQKHSVTITWPSGSNKYLLAQLVNNNDGGQIIWNSAMIEEGTVAHTWSPAPSDMATVTSVTNLSATVDGIQSQVYNSDGSSKITQLSNVIQTKVGTDDFNNLKQAVGLQTLDSADINNMKTNGHYFVHNLANNPIGGWVYVDVTGDGSTRIRQDVYQDSGNKHKYRRWFGTSWTDWEEGATYTEINQLQDAINLRVTKGDLISQINLQAGTSLIQSNKLVLDSGTTIITGEAFIPSAAISSISADKIMLGSTSLWNSDGTLNLVNSNDGINSKITVTQGNVNFDGINKTASIIQFASDNNTNAFTVNPTGATVTPTLFFERFGQIPGHWLGFTRNSIQEEGVAFNTWDNDGERFAVACHARFEKNLRTLGTLSQGSWDGTTAKPEAGVLTIKSGNTIWSGSDFLAIGSNVTGTYTGIWAKSFSQQSTLSSKTNIETVDPKDALDLVNKTDIRSYQYKSDVAQGKNKRYTSLIIDDVNDVSQYYAPNEFTNEERTGRDDGSAVGYLFLAIQELTRRIKTLEDKLNG